MKTVAFPWTVIEPWKILVALFLLVVFGLAMGPVFSYDIFWQMELGEYVLENFRLPSGDPYALIPDQTAFENHSWLYEWLHGFTMHLAFTLFGFSGISILRGSLVAATALLLILTARSRGSSWQAIALILPPVFLTSFWAWNERPQIWTYFYIALFMWILERGRRNNPLQMTIVLVPALVLWANTHGAAIIAYLILIAYLVGEAPIWQQERHAQTLYYRHLWLTFLLVAFLAPVATPGGYYLWELLFQSGSMGSTPLRGFNLDWKKTTFEDYPVFYLYIWICVASVAGGWRRLRATDVLLLGGFGFMGSVLERHIPFFFFAMAAYLPNYVDEIIVRLKDVAPFKWSPRISGALLFIVVVSTVVYWILPAYRYHGYFNPGLRTWHYPISEADFVQREKLPGNLFNSFSAGGYLMWRLYPEYKVFWDGRQLSPTMWNEGRTVTYSGSGWQEILHRHDINLVVTDVLSQIDGRKLPIVDALFHHTGWSLVFAGESHLVFVRNISVSPEWLVRYRKSRDAADATVLSAARHLLSTAPIRENALLEMAKIYSSRGDLQRSRIALESYARVSRNPDPAALRYLETLRRR